MNYSKVEIKYKAKSNLKGKEKEDQSLTSFFGRVGSKTRLKDKIYKQMPTDFKTYVEPYVGGGAVMLGYKFKPDHKIVINDLDKALISGWRKLKNPPSLADARKYNITNVETLNRLKDSKGGGPLKELVKYLLASNNTFGSIGTGKVYKDTNPYNKLVKIPEYQKKLKNATILNQNAIGVINKYNNADTFLFLDPPYENSNDLYDKGEINFEQLASTLRKFKGKFILSINDSRNIRNIFKGFKFRTITDGGSGNSGIGKSSRKELFIRNY
tara:strand:- start:86 stop:895 length:810 start_codon:yes stop_codon:yes gene_type:complete